MVSAKKKKEKESAGNRLKLLYDVGRELAAALDLRTLLHRVLFLSMKNVGAVSGSIIVLDDNAQPVESAFLLIGRPHDKTSLQLRVTYERGMAGWVARNRQAVLVPDTSKDERWLHRPDDEIEKTGPKSAVSTPILVRDKLVGVITLVHPKPGFFTPDHLELVQAIADQAGIAILNANLYTESQRRARVMAAVAESAAVITASLNLDEVLHRILEQIERALQVEGASLALIDPQTHELEFRSSTVKTGKSVVGVRLPIGTGIAGWVAKHGVGVIVPEVRQDARFFPEVDQQLGFETRSILCAPIQSEGQIIGVLEALNPLEEEFDADDLLFLTGISNMAGTAIRHAQLFGDLQIAHQRYRDLFEDSIDPILLTDWSGKIIEANRNAETIIGFSKDTSYPISIENLHCINLEKLGKDYANLKDGKTISYESLLTTQSGRQIPVQVYVRNIMYESISNLQWIFRDITERKELDRLREDLIAMVYHDLRSPLANIISSLDVLNSMLPEEVDSSTKTLLNIALHSTERIERLTNSLLDINRLEAGQPIGERSLVSPQDLIRDAIDAILPIAQNKGQEIVTELQADLPNLLVDEDMIRRVLINLVENAVKFTPTGGKIWVGAQGEDDSVQMWVKDTGPGIAPQDQERIFEKFTRLRQQGSTYGLGLGLAYCKLAVVGHGGQIWVESELGSGATFRFTLPVVEEGKEA